ncbi:dihydrofolate reductase [Polyangium sp. y55x31]|uniref:dihydrofolate reductase n=1 Tax=Polyangium sp. y55x31 TaxID=3042688 RepID=UPI002482EC80|nr:dihydrofolate reductase [Polyangium sp. y55x31]MDI1478312.1 dihydrofolate reductase [Polyangium sp. y55x31]
MTTEPRLALIAAVAENGVIGVENRLPWRLPGDLAHFKATTMGKPILMGRKTWESIGGKPLPGRKNLVVTRKDDYHAPGAVVCHGFAEALERARRLAVESGAGEVVVIGGEGLFAEALVEADRLYLTEVHARPAGDAFFPAFDRAAWREISRRDEPERGPESPAYSILVLDRDHPAF